jgi:hypothetical protein
MTVEFVDRMAIIVAVRRFHGIYMSVCNISFVALLMFLFGVLGGCAAGIHATSLGAVHGTLDSYLRDALQEGQC